MKFYLIFCLTLLPSLLNQNQLYHQETSVELTIENMHQPELLQDYCYYPCVRSL